MRVGGVGGTAFFPRGRGERENVGIICHVNETGRGKKTTRKKKTVNNDHINIT